MFLGVKKQVIQFRDLVIQFKNIWIKPNFVVSTWCKKFPAPIGTNCKKNLLP